MIEVEYNEYKETLEENMRLIPENHKLKKEIERLNKELEDRNSINLACYMLRDDNRELYSQLEKRDNIIKEVREYIEENRDRKTGGLDSRLKKVLEILDKVGSDKE